jgi:hypothetical protein
MRPLWMLVGMTLLAFLLYRAGWRDLVSSFQRLGWPALLILLGLGIIEHVIDSDALRRAMLGRVRMVWVTISNAAGALTNMVIPFEAGEVLKVALLRQRSTDDRVVSGLVIWNYVWKLAKPCAVAGLFFLSLALGNVYPRNLWLPVLAGVAFAFVPYLTLRVVLRQRPAERLMRLLARIPRLKNRAQGWVAGASRLDGDVRSFWQNHPRAFSEVFLLTLVGRLLSLPALYLMASRLGLPADLGSIAFLYAAQTVADYLAMMLPARIGMGEGSAYLLFQALGLPPTAALVIVITLRARLVMVAGPLSLWALFNRPKRAAVLPQTL